MACVQAAATNEIEGFTQPYETVRLATAESGIIRSLPVREGDKVEQGQLIAALDDGVLKAALATARAKAASQGPLKAAQAALRQRESRVTHMQRLRDDGHASPEELERAEVDRDIAEANLIAAQEEQRAHELAVKQIEAQLERREIRSPIQGVITELIRRPGELVTPTDSHIATVVSLDRLRVTCYLPTQRASQLCVDDSVSIFVTGNDRGVQARIEFIALITDADSDTVRVEVIIDNPDGRYRSGVRCVLLDVEPTSAASTRLKTTARTQRGRTFVSNPLRQPRGVPSTATADRYLAGKTRK